MDYFLTKKNLLGRMLIVTRISEYDDKLKQMIKRRNLSDKSIQHYDLVN